MQTSLLTRKSAAAGHSIASQGKLTSKLPSRACLLGHQHAQQPCRHSLVSQAFQQDYAAGGGAAALAAADPCKQQQLLHHRLPYFAVQPQPSEEPHSSTDYPVDTATLLHKNNATETLIELRAARITKLHSVLASRGFAVPAAATLAAADVAAADESLQEQQRLAGNTAAALLLDDSSSFDEVQQRNQQLMRKSRAQNVQIQAMESVLNTAGVPLPRRTLDSTSLSSCSSCSSMSSGDDQSPAAASSVAVPARTPVIAAACVIPKPQEVRRHTIRCEFKVHCDTQLGDHVMVVGSHPALGSWDAEHGGALALSQLSGERGVWSGIMSLDWPLKDYSSKMVSFKVVVQRADGSMEWQKGDSFEMILGPLMGHHVTPAVADVHFEGTSRDGLPLNYQEACASYYNSHYDAEVPEAYARKKAAHEVQQSIKRLRAAVTPSPAGSTAGAAC
ncbi:hypothetical protein OEZ85_003392 [Tetradesmus obliquus]|uniref:CBM20 domain-containing protein n=1 Tax=Tetradesmus obliquus TaxID=3088 RepID=A0ABY8UBD8_TETOB|nr:hypothetical protein OEZ85_003392 [Tetradesmus obliquus]